MGEKAGSKLDEIIAHKRREILPLVERAEKLRAASLERDDFRSLEAALVADPGRLGLLAEVKKASPSAGVIAGGADPVAVARAYEAAGASAISVLTDSRYFGGRLEDMTLVRGAVGVPVLRKDFIVHEAQIYEAAVAGADAILLIVAALGQEDYRRLFDVAAGHQLEVLVEVHDLAELERALEVADLRLVGINNRNLKTFEVDLATTEALAEEVPEEMVLLSESGIRSAGDAVRAAVAGADALLVGEALMRSGDIGAMVGALRVPKPGGREEEELVMGQGG